MIFRKSLVRELTATTIGLFVVLLAILFTQSVIRILARAAGGAIAADGVLALIGFNAMFYLNLLLSVALFLTVLLTLSRWYRDSEISFIRSTRFPASAMAPCRDASRR